MATPEEKERLAQIRRRHEEASTDWQLGSGGVELFAVIIRRTPPAPIVKLLGDCGYTDRDFLMHAHEDITFLLAMLKRAAEKLRSVIPPEDPRDIERREREAAEKNFAAECAMKCQTDRAFRRFLIERHQLEDPADTERVKTRVRSILAISSMGELNEDENAAARWKALRSDFKAWMKVSA
ncbi:hypothetical protein FHT77_000988 [Rhizobium sp. BK181]|uniref:hypothetical protein n=1 Tax=Rhizobium sp. BK181 TaxID=2587072 RepID=UPI0017A3097E|nr:hypothetical protein [Rhizobium sp. BK181]MBB3315146.1 hypothetical protein [Rhizobium sp. BK181]